MQDKQQNRLETTTRLSSPKSGVRLERTPFLKPQASSLKPARQGFTLTELLIVIAIIAVLAGLIAAAAVNAMRSANRSRIVLEIKNISGSLENFKTEYGAYPPNGMHLGSAANPPSGTPGALVKSDFVRMFKQAFPRHQEHPDLIDAIAGFTPPNNNVVTNGPVEDGLTAAEALYFWLGGFSDDPQYPISGEGGPSFVDTGTAGDEILESRKSRYEFDLGRLGPRDDNGSFAGKRPPFTYLDPRNNTITRRINFWQYTPSGSEQPLLYFDTSRHKPSQYDPWASNPTGGAPEVYAMKQIRSGATPAPADLAAPVTVFVNQGKFQILHCGLDDAWSSDFTQMKLANPTTTKVEEIMLYPDGPFIGEIADTLTSFTDGTLEDAVEE